jgi:glycosyltransferase involved in cell wall biosynthesis
VNYEIARKALSEGHTVILVASRVDDELRAHDGVTWGSIPVNGIPTALLRNQVFAWRSFWWIKRHEDEIDVLLANGAITWEGADINVSHFVHSSWLSSPIHTARTKTGPDAWYHGVYTALNALWERWAFRQAETVVAVSEQVKSELMGIGVPDRKIEVVPNGVDTDEFSPGPSRRDALDLPKDVPMGGLVGDLSTPRKNLGTVLRALREVPRFHLAVAGTLDGSPYPALARRLDLDDRVHFLGYCENIPALMRSVDVCLCPSRYEPFSLVLLEALASGCPVITAETVGAADLLPEDAGWVIEEPTDVDALSAKIETAKEKIQSSRIQERAREAAEQFDFDRTSDQYLNLFEEHS